MEFLKKLFKFLSSIKLSVPTMLALLVASVAGTILESKYNAEYSGIVIYKSWWFLIILFFLWINILFAALSRLPWKKRHIGFLITHLGMLMLLFGSVLTMQFGLDGTLQIYEKSDSNMVFLQNNVLEVDGVKVPMKRYLEKRDFSGLALPINFPFKTTTFLPFVDVPEKTYDRGQTLTFKIKSPFFDVVQTLNSDLDKETSMGPATFRIVSRSTPVTPISSVAVSESKNNKNKKSKAKSNSNGNELIVKDKTGNVLQVLSFTGPQTFEVNGAKIKIKSIYRNAQIASNKIEEGDSSRENPAMELEVIKGGQNLREIIYQNIPEFTMNPKGMFGLVFCMKMKGANPPESSGMAASPDMMGAHMAIGQTSGNGDRIKNTVEFTLLENNQVEVALYKNNEQLLKKVLNGNEKLVTPWMGIELTFLSVKNAVNNEAFVPMESEPKRKMPLPPSALLLKLNDGKEAWITENSEMSITQNQRTSSVYYGKERIVLPFALSLSKFEKNDYPGSEMAMDYKSYVQINGQGPIHEIYMNEPLKHEGFTIYQSSYQITPGAPALTVLSVNRDPGRELKYIGSIILCLGIIIYTLQKSKRVQAKFNL